MADIKHTQTRPKNRVFLQPALSAYFLVLRPSRPLSAEVSDD